VKNLKVNVQLLIFKETEDQKIWFHSCIFGDCSNHYFHNGLTL